MTVETEALGRVQTEDGRYYTLNPGTDQEERFRSVTAPLGRFGKDGLVPWSASLAAKAAFDELPSLVAALTLEDCGRSFNAACDDHDWGVRCPQCRCRKCEPCLLRWMRDRHEAESHRRADEGTRVHHLVNHWASTGTWLPPDGDIAVYARSFRGWVEELGLTPDDFELLEARVINREHMYAGTLDCAFHIFRDRSQLAGDVLDRISGDGPRLDQALILGDYKSREKSERQLFIDNPLQLAAYRHGETLVLKDGTESPMFAVDAAAIIQIRPDKTTLELVLAESPEFDVFLCLLATDEWAVDRGKKAIGARTHKFSEPIKKLRAADARRRAKANKLAAAEAAADAPAADETTTDGAPPPEVPPKPGSGTPAERGARAAAAVRRGPSPVLQSLADAHRNIVVPESAPVGRAVTTVEALLDAGDAVRQGMLHVPRGDDDGIPF